MGRPQRAYTGGMNIERVKYVIWAADMDRAIGFYRDLCGGTVLKHNTAIAEVEIKGSVIGIHSGGEGKRPEPENGEPPHLAMCVDPEGNEFRLTRKRG